MARKLELIETGDFIAYRGHLMAVIGTSGEYMYVLNKELHEVEQFVTSKVQEDKNDFKIVKKAGCKALVKAIYSDMDMI